MNLTDIEKKLVMLAMDKGASDGEIAAAASKLIWSLRKRYSSGFELLKDMESGRSLSDLGEILRKMPTQPQPAYGSNTWSDIMADAHRRGQERANRQQQQAQQTWEEYVRRSYQQASEQAQAQAAAEYYEAAKSYEGQPPRKKSFFEKFFKDL